MIHTYIQQKITASDILINPTQKYKTWYDFKRDLESLCGQPILNELWLQIKPKTALPWNCSNLRASYVFRESLK
jgi:hypothetical protein